MSKYFAHYLIMAGLCIKQDLCRGMPELVGGKAYACLIPEGLLDLPSKACAVFRFAVPPGEEVGAHPLPSMHGKEHPQAAGVSDGLQQAKGRRRQSPKAPQVARIFRPDVV